MANPENINLLSKYQMRVLYYKCKEGATHEEIAGKLGREVNTVQYHMTKIYRVLDISRPGKSKEEMDSELKNEICPVIRQMFSTFEDVNIWAPTKRGTLSDDKVDPGGDLIEPEFTRETQSPYQPPPSVERILSQRDSLPVPPEVLEPPPPAIRRMNWRLIIGLACIGLGIFFFWVIYPHLSSLFSPVQEPTWTPTQPIPTWTQPAPTPTEIPTRTPTVPILPTETLTPSDTPVPTATPIEIETEIASQDSKVLVYIPAGEFKMGSSMVDDPQTLGEEQPQHSVYLDAYWIDQTEVTNQQYALCVAAEACTSPVDTTSLTRGSYYDNNQYGSYPVIFVSWSQAEAYCAWVGRRLPTEAEWEKAARGPDGWIYPWGNLFDGRRANYCDINCFNGWKDNAFDDGYIDTSPVGDYPDGASVYGVLDMSGNVYEWVADWYAPYDRADQSNPSGPDSGQEHIIRGGSWGDDSVHIRSAVRSHVSGDFWMNFIGFRCAR